MGAAEPSLGQSVTTNLVPDPHRLAEPLPATSTSLYRRILGDAWGDVADEVRAAHFDGRTIERRGLFRVRRGTGLLARIGAAILRLPAAGDAVPIQLRIEGDGERERWIRHFGRRRLSTLQRPLPDHRLGERFGPLEIVFRLEAVDGGLTYHTVGARLCIGPLGIPLPRGLRPVVEARESAEASGATHVVVDVALPWAGPLIRYEGLLYADARTDERARPGENGRRGEESP